MRKAFDYHILGLLRKKTIRKETRNEKIKLKNRTPLKRKVFKGRNSES